MALFIIFSLLLEKKGPFVGFIVFNALPKDNREDRKLQDFLRELKFFINYDYYYAFAIKCVTGDEVKLKHVVECRKWLKKEIDRVDPHLIILMGSLAKIAVLGRMANIVMENVFYSSKKGIKERKIFIGSNVYGNNMRVKTNLDKILIYIKEYYIAA
jgi:hypothetical protein